MPSKSKATRASAAVGKLRLQAGWRLRPLRPVLRPPLVAFRHRGLGAHDVVLAEYPKSGSTWLTFMLAEVLFGRPIDFVSQRVLAPGIGRHKSAPGPLPGGGRLLRTHEPPRTDYRKAVYIVRHVADVAVSYYHWLPWLGIKQMGFKEFLPGFLRGRLDAYGGWSNHVSSWLNATDVTVHVVRYEDLKRATEGELAEILDFLGHPFEEHGIRRAVEHNTVGLMREKEQEARATVFEQRSAGHHFVRQGVVGRSNAILDDEDFELVEQHAGLALARLDYEVRPSENPR